MLLGRQIKVIQGSNFGLDEATAEQLVKDVISIAETKSLLYVTHRLDELASFDEVVGIENGRVISPGVSYS